jgi:hypothetical protein
MTTVEAEAARIFSDARHMRDAALAQMAAGDVRDAAEKAWCATLRATEALVLIRTGEGPSTSTAAGRRLRALSMSDQSLWDLRDRYLVRQAILHGECFYHDYCDPEETGRLIRETADYIRDAERLAQA